MPKTRTKRKRQAEGVRFTAGQLAALDVLVATEIYGPTRGDVIRFFVQQGLAEFDKRGKFAKSEPR